MSSNGDTQAFWQIGADTVRGVGSFHKTLPHNEYGEVDQAAFAALVEATHGDGRGFSQVPKGKVRAKKDGVYIPTAEFTNPQAGLASDQLLHHPSSYEMPPAPRVRSQTTAAEMVELYWMALLRDHDLCNLSNGGSTDYRMGKKRISVNNICDEINECFRRACDDEGPDRFIHGVDIPGSSSKFKPFDAQTLFRLGLPGDDKGPMISQFFVRKVGFGTQSIDQRQRPYASGKNYLTDFNDWLMAQNSGQDDKGQSYSKANESDASQYEDVSRYIASMRDLARFVNKDALHQAYFNAALILLSGGAKWNTGNPYYKLDSDKNINPVAKGRLPDREAGFGVLGGPHILALVSEVATRALKTVWRQKWQVHLRLRPEAYGGLAHVQCLGVETEAEGVQTRNYGLPEWLAGSLAAQCIKNVYGSYLLPMAYSPGSPTHPAYGAGHATVAGACVTVLKAYFRTFYTDKNGTDVPVPFNSLTERSEPFGSGDTISCYKTTLQDCEPLKPAPKSGSDCCDPRCITNRVKLDNDIAKELTIEGELNKLAQNVAMGRSMGGVHWRTDNTRSLMLGEALAAEILADITQDSNEKPSFTFRTFSRKADGHPKKVLIKDGRIFVDGVEKTIPVSAL
ncbi:MAG: vanadium-dependent haloperoxidase [Beijerinckiaceae bacterium]